jgi:phosphopantothenate synthetase
MPGVIASIAAAKRYDPLWNDRMEVRHSGTIWHANVDLGNLSDQDRAQLLSLAAERATLRLNPAPDSPPTDSE